MQRNSSEAERIPLFLGLYLEHDPAHGIYSVPRRNLARPGSVYTFGTVNKD
jgi:hypothetical protein